jgi:hypothetical protein
MNFLNQFIPKRDILWPHRVAQNADGTWDVFHELLGKPTVFGRFNTLEGAVSHAQTLNERAWAKNDGGRLASPRAPLPPRRKWDMFGLFRLLHS